MMTAEGHHHSYTACVQYCTLFLALVLALLGGGNAMKTR
jgi:hypothetical protein